MTVTGGMVLNSWLVGLNMNWDYLVSHYIVGSRDLLEFPPFLYTTDSSLT